MFKNKYHTVGTISKFNTKIVEKGKIDTSNTQIRDGSLSWRGTGNGTGVKLVLYAHTW